MIYLINTEFIFIIIFNWESPDNNGDGWTVCLTFPQFSRGFIKVLNRRATEFDTRAKNWQGPEGLAL